MADTVAAGAALASLFADADAEPLGANRPFPLSSGRAICLVEQGSVDVFLLRGTLVDPRGRRHHLLHVDAGGLLLPVEGVPDGWSVIAVAVPDTRIRRLGNPELEHAVAASADVAASVGTAVRTWIRLAGGRVEEAGFDVRTIPAPGEVSLDAGERVEFPEGAGVKVTAGRLTIGSSTAVELTPAVPAVVVPAATWFGAPEPSRLRVDDPLADGWSRNVRERLAGFHALVLGRVIEAVRAGDDVVAEQMALRYARQQAVLHRAVVDVASVLDPERAPASRPESDDHLALLLDACEHLGTRLDIEFVAPPSSYRDSSDPVSAIAMASGVRHRRVLLEDGWDRRASTPLLGFLADTGDPVALVPQRRGFLLYEPRSGRERRVDRSVLHSLGDAAYEFSTPLPNRPLGLRDLLRIGFAHQRQALWTLVVAGVIGGLVALALPLATGRVFNDIIPADARSDLTWIAVFLFAAVVSGGFLAYARSLAVVRLSGNLDAVLQAGVWDRLLALPTDFFRRYSTGDLTSRAYGINAINTILSNATIGALLSTVFAIFSLALLFSYSIVLALFALSGVVTIGLVLAALSARQVRYQRTMFLKRGAIYGRLYQLLQGLEKVRIAGREIPAFAQWAGLFREQKRADYHGQLLYCWLATVIGATPLVLSMLLFAVAGGVMHGDIATGTFIGFTTALAQFTAAATQLNFALVASIAVVPLYERLEPILQAVPEGADDRRDPGLLSGDVELDNVHFRYSADAEPTLRGVSMRFRRGTCTAVVGPSGAGKSTVLRMLLGFERPERGVVLYDGLNLDTIDLRMLRRQIGVVLQNSAPMPGDILSNVVGSSNATVDDAWRALDAAGLADDVKRMPMQLHTMVSEGGTTFSGGQIQRLMIARAIVRRPRLVYFDEATSALDNDTQAEVTAAVTALDATRVIIAHRLSTIRDADYVYVVDHGQVVQAGTFDELMSQPGLFADLVRRQSV
jgi:NHLM bacteriocin system ABC transporter ATP-binding protein